MPASYVMPSRLSFTTMFQSIAHKEIAFDLRILATYLSTRQARFPSLSSLPSTPELYNSRYFASLPVVRHGAPASNPHQSKEAGRDHLQEIMVIGRENGSATTREAFHGRTDIASSMIVEEGKSSRAVRRHKGGNSKGTAGGKRKHFTAARTPKSAQSPETTVPGRGMEKKKLESWQTQKDALKKKFKDGWAPLKRLSPDALEGIRHLHATTPDQFTTPILAEQFKVSPEVIRRILKSKWRPTGDEMEARQKRWERRHNHVWDRMAELGLRPKRKSTESLSSPKNVTDPNSGQD